MTTDARKIYDFMDELGMKPTPWQLQFLERFLAADEPIRVLPVRNNVKKLTKRDALVIRQMRRAGSTQQEIADSFDCNRATISRICRGHYWK